MVQLDKLINDIAAKGGKIYKVGGPVRDSFLGETNSKDLDLLVCSIPIEALKIILQRHGSISIVGQSFGVIKFNPDSSDETIDISLPRKERSTGVSHRDFEVDFDPDLPIEEDLGRRDFTINAMAQNYLTGELIDPFNGQSDLKNKILRMVSRLSFVEDPLRILRGIQFAARFELQIEPVTFEAMKANAPLVTSVSPERIAEELNKLLLKAAKPSSGFRLMNEIGLLPIILPELAETVGVEQPGGYHRWDVFEHTLQAIDNALPKLNIRLAAVFHDCGKPSTREIVEGGATFYGHDRASQKMAERALKRLRYSNEIIDQVSTLVGKHMFSEKAGDKGIRRLISKVGLDLIYDLISLRRADTMAQGMGQDTTSIDEFRLRVEEEINKKPAFGIKDLAVDGNDIMTEIKIQSGPLVGEILKYLLDIVLDEPAENVKERLIEIAREYFRKRQLDF